MHNIRYMKSSHKNKKAFSPFYHKKITHMWRRWGTPQNFSQSYDVRFLRYGVRQTEFFVILGHFLPFYHHPIMIPKNQNFERKKMKKCLEILSFYTYMCTIYEDHIIYGSSNIRCNRQKILSFWAIFCLYPHHLPPSHPPQQQPQKSKFWRNEKTTATYDFTHVHHKSQSYNVWFLMYEAWPTKLFVNWDCFLPFYPTNNPQN